jgi:2-iminobutanoate/2-iminopropanoate deaminase
MNDVRRIRLTDRLADPISHYVDATVAGDLLWISGMLPVDAAGELVGKNDVTRQTEQVLANVGAVLESEGVTFQEVVRVGVFVRHMVDRGAINIVRQRCFGSARPASTLVEVSALAHPDALVEIEAVALLPRQIDVSLTSDVPVRSEA